jgi:enhancing lycopene biosynthesis protein 2
MGKRVAVILSGCGVQDGSEIHEAVLTLLYLDQCGATVTAASVDKPQARVFDHQAGREAPETRNVRTESARIVRGAVKDVRSLRAADFDAAILPGGFGAALNLSTFGPKGADCAVDEGVAAFLRELCRLGKPIGAICIAPAIVARLFGSDLRPQLTIGSDAGTAAALEKMGARHVARAVDEIAVDEKLKIVTTPAYMLARGIKEAAAGIEKLVRKVIELA